MEADTPQGKTIYKLINAGISVYSAHTNLDAASQGLNQHLAEMLQLQDIKPLTTDKQDELIQSGCLCAFDYVKAVQTAMAEAGAGHIGKYSACSFRTRDWKLLPGGGSQPFIGSVGILEEVEEYRLKR